MKRRDDWSRNSIKNIEKEKAQKKTSLRGFDLSSLFETSSESELKEEHGAD